MKPLYPCIEETGETPKQIGDFEPSNASGNVSSNDDSIETPLQGETPKQIVDTVYRSMPG